ncbi:Os11g0642300 [Oryza sativa Japonica Group]|uniref:Os11g0642300 protein n=1 Tax=Oryza sativa subsp. japonica TaxID=39947 RepID=A0A0N7KT98_ORYSJ|nr:Os11g0642300 [Oryza sativa Japonica Group]
MAIGAGGDRLSALPDDLLLRVLHFANAVEAASTSLLSRRFGALWRSSGAVNLAARVPGAGGRDAFVRAADAALAAAGRVVTRLTLHVDDGDHSGYCTSMYNLLRDHDVVDAVVSHPAARRVEELRVAVAVHPFGHDKINTMISSGSVRIYDIKLASLPSKTLRVLDLTNCRNLTPASAAAAATAFPWLDTLRLRHCIVRRTSTISTASSTPRQCSPPCTSIWSTRLRFPAATVLVLINCDTTGAMEIYAPRLRSFTYKGDAVQPFDLQISPAPPPDMALVNLHFTHAFCRHDYLHFIHNFTMAIKVLKLKAPASRHLSDMAFVRVFPNIEHLELDGAYDTWNKTAAAVASILHCCPVLRELKLNLVGTSKNSKRVQHFFRRNSQNSLRRVSLQFKLANDNSKSFGVRLVKFFAENAVVLEELRILTVGN